ncbi:MAG: hypothetical protein QME96_05345 [Myxococcota bacterium]|nr:hypothetical protein [Myxococcota bacterium]
MGVVGKCASVVLLAVLGAASPSCADGDGEGEDAADAARDELPEVEPEADGDAEADPDTDAGADATGDGGAVPPGGECTCDSDCASVDGHAGRCVFGICMTAPAAACSAAGSRAECAAGSRCWSLAEPDIPDSALCWPDCDAYSCAGRCDADGSCVPAAGMGCDRACGFFCNLPGSLDPGPPSPPGPGPDCPDLPPLRCSGSSAYCAEIVPFDPDEGPGYWDYPQNGETAADQYRSYLRRDVMMLIQYAAAKVACKSADWTTGNGAPLGLGDMSEADGSIPGTREGSPDHPAGTHTGGRDIDVAYYQVTTSDNRLRPICPHRDSAGRNAQRCTDLPDNFDAYRTALFVGALAEHPNLRVVGVDGQVSLVLRAAIERLCSGGWIDPDVCADGIPLGYELIYEGRGWYLSHHHHAHVSCPPSAKSPPQDGAAYVVLDGVRLWLKAAHVPLIAP